jgi:phosphoribosyl 1,2-cyclic phosphodiesterase
VTDVRLVVLGSSSSGNATLVEADGAAVLVDAGFSCRELERRITSVGADVQAVRAILLTHEHSDHTAGVRVLARRQGIPVYATPGTVRALGSTMGGVDLRPVPAWEPFEHDGFRVTLVPIPHDATEPAAVRVDVSERRMLVATDMGHFPWSLLEVGQDMDALVFESNHDARMLEQGPYPVHLKRRIQGPRGHLSNAEAAKALRVLLGPRTTNVLLGHISQTNNTQDLALETVVTGLPEPIKEDVTIRTTSPHRPLTADL